MSATPAPAPVPGPAPHEPDDEPRPYNFATAVYGLISVGAVLAAESASRETYGETVAAVVVAMILYWLAHAYAENVWWRIREGERLNLAGLRRLLLQEVPMLAGAAPPLIVVLIAWAAGAGLGTAITIAVWTVAVAILATEVASGLQADLSGRDLLMDALLGATLGVLILVLKLVLH